MDPEVRAAVLRVAGEMNIPFEMLEREKRVVKQLQRECSEGHDKRASLAKSKRRIEAWRSRLAVKFEALLAQAKEGK